MIQEWPKPAGKTDQATEKEFGLVRELVTAVRNIRATYKVEPGKRIEVEMFCGNKAGAVSEQSAVIAALAKISKLDISKARSSKLEARSYASQVASGVQVFVPLGSLVDFVAEKRRLTDELAQTEKYSASLEAKLGNESFVSRAPAAVVEGERAKLAEQKLKTAKIKEQLAALG